MLGFKSCFIQNVAIDLLSWVQLGLKQSLMMVMIELRNENKDKYIFKIIVSTKGMLVV